MSSSITEQLDTLHKQYSVLSKNMRRLLISGVLALIYALVDLVLVQPLMDEFSEVTKAVEKAKADTKSYTAKMLNVQNKFGIDPTLSDQEQIEKMTNVLKKLEAEISRTSSEFVDPRQMVDLLYAMLNQGKTLSLIAIEKLPVDIIDIHGNSASTLPANLDVSDAKEALQSIEKIKQSQHKDNKDSMYRYEVELTVQGSYIELLNYLQKLESLPWNLFWENVELKVKEHPVSELRLSVYTISLHNNWMTL